MKPKDRAQQLLATALTLFAERGFSAKHTDIAELANVSVPTTFVYFETRTALVDAVLKEVSRFFLEKVSEKSDNRINNCTDALLEAIHSHPDYAKVWLMWSVLFEPELHHRYQQFENKLIDSILLSLAGSENHPGQGNSTKRTQAHLILGSVLLLARMTLSHDEDEVEIDQNDFIEHVMESVTHTSSATL